MRIQLSDDLNKEEVEKQLKSATIVDHGEYILIRKKRRVSVYDENGTVYLEAEDISYVESVGNDVFVVSDNMKYVSTRKLYEHLQYSSALIRISKSVIVNKHKIVEIRPSINMKFKILVDQTWHEVNRTYYYEFKDEIGI